MSRGRHSLNPWKVSSSPPKLGGVRGGLKERTDSLVQTPSGSPSLGFAAWLVQELRGRSCRAGCSKSSSASVRLRSSRLITSPSTYGPPYIGGTKYRGDRAISQAPPTSSSASYLLSAYRGCHRPWPSQAVHRTGRCSSCHTAPSLGHAVRRRIVHPVW